MSTVRKSNIFSEEQEKWIKAQIEEGHFVNDSEYIRNLVRQDQKSNDKLAKLKLVIDEGLESGVSSQSVTDIMKTVEKRIRQDGKP